MTSNNERVTAFRKYGKYFLNYVYLNDNEMRILELGLFNKDKFSLLNFIFMFFLNLIHSIKRNWKPILLLLSMIVLFYVTMFVVEMELIFLVVFLIVLFFLRNRLRHASNYILRVSRFPFQVKSNTYEYIVTHSPANEYSQTYVYFPPGLQEQSEIDNYDNLPPVMTQFTQIGLLITSDSDDTSQQFPIDLDVFSPAPEIISDQDHRGKRIIPAVITRDNQVEPLMMAKLPEIDQKFNDLLKPIIRLINSELKDVKSAEESVIKHQDNDLKFYNYF